MNALNLNAPVDTLAMEFTREFDAPVEALFRAHADPDLVKKWLGPRGLEMEVTEWEFKNHGGYRYVHSNDDGEFAFNGTFHTVRENEFILQTFEFEGMPDNVNIEYMWFEDLGDGRTRLHAQSLGDSFEGRDAMLSSGMDTGVHEGYAKLDALLADGAI